MIIDSPISILFIIHIKHNARKSATLDVFKVMTPKIDILFFRVT